MPKKRKVKKEQIIVAVNKSPIKVILHPPNGKRKSWYAYWNGLATSKSTGQFDKAKAIEAVEGMLNNEGKPASLASTVLSDEEFEKVQRKHYGRRKEQRNRCKVV